MWDINARSGPVYRQIAKRIEGFIAKGDWPPGFKMPSVKDVAKEAGINPNTVVAAYADLEQRHIIEKRRGLGAYVLDHVDVSDLRSRLFDQAHRDYLSTLYDLGIPLTEAIDRLSKENEIDR